MGTTVWDKGIKGGEERKRDRRRKGEGRKSEERGKGEGR